MATTLHPPSARVSSARRRSGPSGVVADRRSVAVGWGNPAAPWPLMSQEVRGEHQRSSMRPRRAPGPGGEKWAVDDARGGVREQEMIVMFRRLWLQVGGASRGMPPRQRSRCGPSPVIGLLACLASCKVAASRAAGMVAGGDAAAAAASSDPPASSAGPQGAFSIMGAGITTAVRRESSRAGRPSNMPRLRAPSWLRAQCRIRRRRRGPSQRRPRRCRHCRPRPPRHSIRFRTDQSRDRGLSRRCLAAAAHQAPFQARRAT